MGLKFNSNWVPSFQLTFIGMNSCKLGPYFPSWLQTQTNASYLDISNSSISGPVPSWFTNITSNLNYLNMSKNLLNNTLPNIPSLEHFRVSKYSPPLNDGNISFPITVIPSSSNSSEKIGDFIVDLSFNQFQGSVPPSLSSTATALYLSNNKFTDLRSFLCDAKNEFNRILIIDLSHNKLSGNISDCWDSFQHLCILNLEHNELFGEIPSSIQMNTIETLQLGHNNFSGSLPSSLENCTSLQVLDLPSNSLEGPIPSWIGEKLNKLVFLSLKSNKFNGSIPLNLCLLTQIQILDLSLNDLSGAIPHCIKNFTAMAQADKNLSSTLTSHVAYRKRYFTALTQAQSSTLTVGVAQNISPHTISSGAAQNITEEEIDYSIGQDVSYLQNILYMNYATVTWKGKEHEYEKNLGLLRIIDLSSNKLNGEIPIEVAVLSQLVLLNLSMNNLSGRIPEKIGNMMKLEVLDLSHNKLYGPIPTSLAKVSFLSYLDLSNNQLSGRIPTGTQLQTFNASMYSMNPGLCGPPLSSCPGDETFHDHSCSTYYCNEGDDENDGEWFDLPWFYKGIGAGFVIGFCGICGNLMINTSWRQSYFKLMHNIGDWLYVMIIIKWALLRRKLSLH